MRDYYKVEKINDINLQMLLNDYIEVFTKRKLIVKTSYFKLEQLEIRFNKRDIHHLLGFHKIQNKKVNATKTLQLILEGNLTISEIKAHHNFGEIRNRLLNYNFLHKCFINQEISLCVIPKESSKNPQNLSVLFIDKYNNINMMIGLKLDSRGRYYVPATMYQINDSSIYQRTKRTRITNMWWEDY
ncbi:PBECR4 domain-containing protein [Staphylococcus schleiferi]|uniref:PBECR4 domain-containing protein n=1 Tax=Staphylococcus schleiferi TaxID=1295 RepID=UPI0021D2F44C|nr:PBECR4 domain-containing protein [Staphylococcus schleiferi]UXR54474.1 PBECR4 domain-containing protein [Staphylococcus schleiferi]UXR56781.1 PBECR4 domain-containing protein [Staphylococcus schleiferi]UXR59065.1 PBECR4 domain-containing protein [Staphylococcus schleiferi]UXR61380.1 PBECR4 domain-containing protein [Staphylococcus schleiferi]